MKYLLLLAFLAVVYLVWRARQRPRPRASRQANPPPATPSTESSAQDMVRCAVCDLHLPHSDAVTNPKGQVFCSTEHRDQAGR